jgi:hypothetical protein
MRMVLTASTREERTHLVEQTNEYREKARQSERGAATMLPDQNLLKKSPRGRV